MWMKVVVGPKMLKIQFCKCYLKIKKVKTFWKLIFLKWTYLMKSWEPVDFFFAISFLSEDTIIQYDETKPYS